MVQSTGKNKYGYLLYDSNAVNKISTIKKYRDMGFLVKEVKVFLESTEKEQGRMIRKRLSSMRLEVDRLNRQINIAEELIK